MATPLSLQTLLPVWKMEVQFPVAGILKEKSSFYGQSLYYSPELYIKQCVKGCWVGLPHVWLGNAGNQGFPLCSHGGVSSCSSSAVWPLHPLFSDPCPPVAHLSPCMSWQVNSPIPGFEADCQGVLKIRLLATLLVNASLSLSHGAVTGVLISCYISFSYITFMLRW